MRWRLLWKNIGTSYKTYFYLLGRTFWKNRDTQARFTPRRFFTMIFFSVFLFILQTLHWLGFLLDEVLFRRYRAVKVQHPLFVVGVPRSGTTFLHRLLAADHQKFTTFALWELVLAPSITERKIILGLMAMDRRLGGVGKGLINAAERRICQGLDNIHHISLSDPEEDYFLLAPVYACFLMILPFPFFEDLGYLAFFDEQAAAAEKERVMAFYKSCLQRHLYVKGSDKILLSKNVSFGPMVETLARAFPDCRIVGTVRDPLAAVGSHISSMMEGAAVFDNDVRGQAFREQMIAVQRYAYTHLAKVLPDLPENRHQLVKMEDLKSSLKATVQGIYERFGYELPPAFAAYLDQQDQRQKTYQSGHAYDLATYDLSREDILSRFGDVYRRYDYPLETAPSARKSSWAAD